MTGPLLTISALGILVSILVGARAPKFWLAGVLVSMVGGLSAAVVSLSTGAVWDWRSVITVGGEIVHLRLDAVSGLFLALLCLVGGAGAIYGREYWSERAHPRSARAGRVWWSMLVLCLGLVLVASNGLHFLVAWELFAVSAYYLITLDRQRRKVRAAGWLYRAALENILGFQKHGETLSILPCNPSDWKEFEITYRYKTATYHIRVENPDSVCGGSVTIEADGKMLSSNRIKLLDDGQEHKVHVILSGAAIKEIAAVPK